MENVFQEMNGHADKLKSAESAIHFIQKEHERVLHGLHMEIERLQQKCSGKYLLYKPKDRM